MPVGPYRLPGAGRDGVLRRARRRCWRGCMHVDGEPVTVRAWAAARRRADPGRGAQRGGGRGSRSSGCASRSASTTTCVPFHRALPPRPRCSARPIRGASRGCARAGGPSRSRRWPGRCRAADRRSDGRFAIQRALVARHGPRSACGRLRDVPRAAARRRGLRRRELEACGLSPKRAIALVAAAREVACGRADLAAHEPAWASAAHDLAASAPWTRRVPGVPRPGPRRPAARRRPRVRQAGRAASPGWGAARPRTRCASSSRRTRRSPGWPAPARSSRRCALAHRSDPGTEDLPYH